jgi:hypothetical protein
VEYQQKQEGLGCSAFSVEYLQQTHLFLVDIPLRMLNSLTHLIPVDIPLRMLNNLPILFL